MTPPKPTPRPDRVSLWRYLRLFRADILSAQPARLYRAKMAEFRTPFFRSYLINEPALIDEVLKRRAADFPKSDRISEGLRPLLGNSVFLTNGAEWERQRRIIDPAFERGRIKDVFPHMVAAGHAAVARLADQDGAVNAEAVCSHAAADVIFRTLFSIPITDATATSVYENFQAYQRAQPLLNLGAFLPLPRWMPRGHRRAAKTAARTIRKQLTDLVTTRAAAIRDGTAPDDLATKIMTTPDPETGKTFEPAEMVDQVAIFFLAGHETSASALAWALYLLATHPEAEDRAAAEAAALPATPAFSDLSRLGFVRDVFRETLRLYPPVPMMVRSNTRAERFRDRDIAKGAQIVISPWHLHRHERKWDQPDAFDPDRYATDNGQACLRDAYMPFSAGPRVCIGAGFAMAEGPLLLAMLLRSYRFEFVGEMPPKPVAHLTVRSQNPIRLKAVLRENPPSHDSDRIQRRHVTKNSKS